MRLATWNVNSIRARLPRVLPWLEQARPDVVFLQETKVQDEQFPREPFEDLGYHVEVYGQKTYNGVAILSLARPTEVRRGMAGEGDDAPRRVLTATIDDLILVNAYVVNGEAVASPKYALKLDWMKRLAGHIASLYDRREKLVVAGDFNVTFDDRDVYDPDAWREKILCSTPEREALRQVMSPGLFDAFRRFHEEGGHYTWWDFRTGGFRRNHGLRIDHFLMNEAALASCRTIEIDRAAREGERPSDHAPLVATLG